MSMPTRAADCRGNSKEPLDTQNEVPATKLSPVRADSLAELWEVYYLNRDSPSTANLVDKLKGEAFKSFSATQWLEVLESAVSDSSSTADSKEFCIFVSAIIIDLMQQSVLNPSSLVSSDPRTFSNLLALLWRLYYICQSAIDLIDKLIELTTPRKLLSFLCMRLMQSDFSDEDDTTSFYLLAISHRTDLFSLLRLLMSVFSSTQGDAAKIALLRSLLRILSKRPLQGIAYGDYLLSIIVPLLKSDHASLAVLSAAARVLFLLITTCLRLPLSPARRASAISVLSGWASGVDETLLTIIRRARASSCHYLLECYVGLLRLQADHDIRLHMCVLSLPDVVAVLRSISRSSRTHLEAVAEVVEGVVWCFEKEPAEVCRTLWSSGIVEEFLNLFFQTSVTRFATVRKHTFRASLALAHVFAGPYVSMVVRHYTKASVSVVDLSVTLKAVFDSSCDLHGLGESFYVVLLEVVARLLPTLESEESENNMRRFTAVLCSTFRRAKGAILGPTLYSSYLRILRNFIADGKFGTGVCFNAVLHESTGILQALDYLSALDSFQDSVSAMRSRISKDAEVLYHQLIEMLPSAREDALPAICDSLYFLIDSFPTFTDYRVQTILGSLVPLILSTPPAKVGCLLTVAAAVAGHTQDRMTELARLTQIIPDLFAAQRRATRMAAIRCIGSIAMSLGIHATVSRILSVFRSPDRQQRLGACISIAGAAVQCGIPPIVPPLLIEYAVVRDRNAKYSVLKTISFLYQFAGLQNKTNHSLSDLYTANQRAGEAIIEVICHALSERERTIRQLSCEAVGMICRTWAFNFNNNTLAKHMLNMMHPNIVDLTDPMFCNVLYSAYEGCISRLGAAQIMSYAQGGLYHTSARVRLAYSILYTIVEIYLGSMVAFLQAPLDDLSTPLDQTLASKALGLTVNKPIKKTCVSAYEWIYGKTVTSPSFEVKELSWVL